MVLNKFYNRILFMGNMFYLRWVSQSDVEASISGPLTVVEEWGVDCDVPEQAVVDVGTEGSSSNGIWNLSSFWSFHAVSS